MTKLERIMKLREKPAPNESLTEEYIQEAEVLVAWVTGKVDTAEATTALALTHTSGISQKAGAALRNLATNGYISIAWNAPLEEK